MQVTVKFSEKSNFASITINQQETYKTVENNGFLVQKIELQRFADNKPILQTYCRMLPPKFKIIMENGIEYLFKMDGVQALKYSCEKNGILYEVYQHKDRKHSIFKNEVQIAYFDKDEYAKFGADRYILVADEHSDIELFLGFLLILHLIHGSDKKSFSSKDIGNIWEKRAFDVNWKPK